MFRPAIKKTELPPASLAGRGSDPAVAKMADADSCVPLPKFSGEQERNFGL
jgi:hypothetical protein